MSQAGQVTSVRCWTDEEFGASEREWAGLLGRSAADPLFLSWDWQWLWWATHRELLGGVLAVVACYDGPELVGLAPFYRHAARHRGGLRATRLEFIGSTWRDGRGVFSEYLDLIAARGHESAVAAAVSEWLRADRDWSDLVLGNTPADGRASALAPQLLGPGGLVREADGLDAHRLALAGDFDSYLKGLPGSIRRKVWNQRSKLESPRLVVADPGQADAMLDAIDAFHLARWNAPQYVGVAREFHRGIAARLARAGALRMSTLESGGRPLVVMYNVRLGGTEYNLQSGFDAERSGGLSPGYLHFGYSIEEAFRDGLGWFDFLGGEGRQRQYKQDFMTEIRPLTTLQVVRSAPLRVLYRVYDRLRGPAPARAAVQ